MSILNIVWVALGAISVAWLFTCFMVYAKLNGVISPDSWHWKLYAKVYHVPPKTDCAYTWVLVATPIFLAGLTAVALFSVPIAAGFMLLNDWAITPLFHNERVVGWRSADYWRGIAGFQVSGERWPKPPERVEFLPMDPLEWALGILAAVAMIWLIGFAKAAYLDAYHNAPNTVMVATLAVVAVALLIGAIFLLRNRFVQLGRTIAAGVRKIKERTCHLVSSPPIE